jgi:hypothetical protein
MLMRNFDSVLKQRQKHTDPHMVPMGDFQTVEEDIYEKLHYIEVNPMYLHCINFVQLKPI